MKHLLLLLGGALAVIAMTAAAEETRLFEMRTYHIAPGQIEEVHQRFRQHANPLFKKHGITVIGHWVPVNPQNQPEERLIVVLAFPNRQAREAAWKTLVNDPQWRAAFKPPETAGPFITRIEHIFLRATDYSPAIEPSSENAARIFELRTYKAAPGKLDALHDRFRNHTLGLFARHGMTHVAYWTPVDRKSGADDTLIYILAHADRKAAQASFKAFRADPEWIAAKAASEKEGSLTSQVDSMLMQPADYSPIR
jgi:hypothetical protein